MPNGAPVPAVHYADSDGLKIAYQVFGRGPVDLIMVPGFISHIEYAWHEPLQARFLRQLSAMARVITFDKRGMGLSDRNPKGLTPTLPQREEDLRAVMSAAGVSAATLVAWSEGGPTAISFCAHHPDLCEALVLIGTTPRFTSDDDFACGIPREVLEVFVDALEEEWGSGIGFELYAPTLADDLDARAWWAAYQRVASSPGAVAASLRMHLAVDVRNLLPQLHLPTLIVHQTHDMVIPVECGRFLARHIQGARLHERRGTDHMYWLDRQDDTITVIRSVLALTPRGAALATMRGTRRRAEAGWESLTAAELDVVRFVRAGMTNPRNRCPAIPIPAHGPDPPDPCVPQTRPEQTLRGRRRSRASRSLTKLDSQQPGRPRPLSNARIGGCYDAPSRAPWRWQTNGSGAFGATRPLPQRGP